VGFVFISHQGLDIAAAVAAKNNAASLTGGKAGWAAAAAVIGGLSWGLGYLGQPHLVTKFMAIRRVSDIDISRKVAIVWTLMAYIGAALVGIVGITIVHHGMVPLGGLVGSGGDPERVLPVLANFLFPAWLAGILIAGAVAAMMSTADSQLLVTTSTIVEDFYSKALGRSISQRGLVLMSRVVTMGVGLLALLLAYTSDDLIYDIVSMAWAGLGSSFGPALLLLLHWDKMNGLGVLASMIVGALSTALWISVPGLDELISVRFASFALSTAAALLGSLAGKNRT
jgi:sodium/proline symporter